MRVLWLCNLILPEIAQALSLPSIPKEGWVAGLFHTLVSLCKKGEWDSLPILCFPVGDPSGVSAGEVSLTGHPDLRVRYHAFYENPAHPETYDPGVEMALRQILAEEQPDIVHAFGSEFPHTLAMAKALNDPSRLLISLQGIMDIYADCYPSNLPESVWKSATLRDRLKKDPLPAQQEKYRIRAEYEKEALLLCDHVGGRTSFDKEYADKAAPGAAYHLLGENLRSCFYEAAEAPSREPHRIFASQGDYPIKGLHYLLRAAGEILRTEGEKYADLQIYVAGQIITGETSLYRRILIGAYGKYIRKLIASYGLKDHVHFLGRLDGEGMKAQYLRCGLYVCPSSIENSPNSVGEAMLLETPVVAARVGGIPDMCTEEEGYLYDCRPEDPEEVVSENLKETILRAWENPTAMKAKLPGAKAHAARSYDREKNAGDLLSCYRQMGERA